MLDQQVGDSLVHLGGQTDTHYDLVVVGAGIAGLNALNAASHYLPRTARVLLVDQKEKPGGMWTMAYDYVRLHQPHPFFTVGDMPWKLQRPRQYLAARDEVQQHLSDCLTSLRDRFHLQERFDHSVSDVREVEQSGGWYAEVDLHPMGVADSITTIRADRVIYAYGFDYQSPEPIALSSQNVVSVTPAKLGSTLADHPGAPVYIVGGGKTGMDTVIAVLDENPKRSVTLINGNGTYFLNRTKFFPTGIRRWIKGALGADIFQDCATRFDGHNEDEVRAHFIATYAVNNDPRSQNYIYGILSEEENKRIEAGLEEKIWDYLFDVVDGSKGPVLQMRHGAEMAVADGSIFVNCTGSLLRKGDADNWMPCLSPHDTILSINTRQSAHILTTYASFMLSHLFFNGKLREADFFFLDLETLLSKSKTAFTAATTAQSYHNLLMARKNLPGSAFKDMGIDVNRWYPALRQLLALNGIRKTAVDDVKHCRKSLEAVIARFDLKGGKLE